MGNAAVLTKKPYEAIERKIKEDREEMAATVKMILLGSGESGKSTLVRQMKILKTDGFSASERSYFRDQISRNLAEWTVLLCQSGSGEDEELHGLSETINQWVLDFPAPDVIFPVQVRNAINKVLEKFDVDHEQGSRSIALREMQDSALYVFSRRGAIMADDYEPTNDDILRCRIATTGVHELQFKLGGHLFRVIDVGGQRGQRKKWIHHFDDLQGLIFVTALSDYDRVLVEDGRTNRMVDSLTLFDAVATNPVFQKASILVFFNKADVFRKKLFHSPLSACFDGYRCPGGADVYEHACEFVKEQFMRRKPKDRRFYSHFTTATDPSNVNKVLQVTFDLILAQNAKDAGFS